MCYNEIIFLKNEGVAGVRYEMLSTLKILEKVAKPLLYGMVYEIRR